MQESIASASFRTSCVQISNNTTQFIDCYAHHILKKAHILTDF